MSDVESATDTFHRSFGFPVRGVPGSGETSRLSVGPAEIEVLPARDGPPGLHSVVLRVESLEQARAELEERGYAPAQCEIDGRPALALGPEGINGTRLVLLAG